MKASKPQSSSLSEPANESQTACEFDKFPQPRTMPTGWDLSELLGRVRPSKYGLINQRTQAPHAVDVSPETDPAPGQSEGF